MKLNSHGWSVKEMIFCFSILFIALIVVSYNSTKLSHALENVYENTSKEVTYSTIEDALREASLDYIAFYYNNEIGESTITVTKENLILNDFLNSKEFITNESDMCSGYALIQKNEQNVLYAEPFIHCDSYETKNYQNWRIGV